MQEHLVNDFETIQWGNILYNMKLVITDCKILNFQYKLVHKISVCNSWLSKLRIKDHSTCDKCNESIDTLEHRYWECPAIQEFLEICFDKLKSLGFISNINICSFLLGQGILTSEIVLYEIFAIIKYHIYKKSLSLGQINFDELLFSLKNTFEVEKRIATNKGDKEKMKFNFKWKNFLRIWNENLQIL